VKFKPVVFYHPARDEIVSWPSVVKKELGSVLT